MFLAEFCLYFVLFDKKRNKKESVKCRKLYYEYILRGGFIAALKQQFEFCTFDSKSFIFSILFQDICRRNGGCFKYTVATP